MAKQDMRTLYQCPKCLSIVIEESSHQCSECGCFRKKIMSRPDFRKGGK